MKRVFACILLVGALTACTSSELEVQLSELTKEVESLKSDNIELLDENEKLKNGVAEIEDSIGRYEETLVEIVADVDTLDEINDEQNTKIEDIDLGNSYRDFRLNSLESNDSAYMSIYDTGYAVAETDLGKVVVMIEEVTPYLDGYNVEIKVGNLGNFTYSGLELRVICISSDFDTEEFSFTINKDIYGGYWNEVSITIPSLEFENLEYLHIYFTSNSIKLNN